MQKISTVAINNESDADLPGNHSPLRNVIKGCVCPACSGIAFPHEPQLFLEKFRSCPSLISCAHMLRQAKIGSSASGNNFPYDIFVSQQCTITAKEDESAPKNLRSVEGMGRRKLSKPLLHGNKSSSEEMLQLRCTSTEDFDDYILGSAPTLDTALGAISFHISSSCGSAVSCGSNGPKATVCEEHNICPSPKTSPFNTISSNYSWYQGMPDKHIKYNTDPLPRKFTSSEFADGHNCVTRRPPMAFLGDEESVYHGQYFAKMVMHEDMKQHMTLFSQPCMLGGIHMPAKGTKETAPLLLTLGFDEDQLEHWVTAYALSKACEANDCLPFEVRSMPVHDLIEGPDKETGKMPHGWFCSYVLGYAVIDTYVPAIKQDSIAEYSAIKLRESSVRRLLMKGKVEFGKDPLRWGERILVLKQNMLFEYASSKDVLNSYPVGFLPLCGSLIEPLEGSPYALSICAMRIPVLLEREKYTESKKFVRIVLGAPNESKRDLWLNTLQCASSLKHSDIYTFIDLPSNEVITTDSGKTVSLSLLESSYGKYLGRCAPSTTIHLAKRNVPGGHYCAIKKLKTRDFFLAVSKKVERYDAHMREVYLQSMLSVKECPNGIHPIVPLIGVFETEYAVFIEMELMSNVDLFDRISTLGIPPIDQSACIIRKLIESAKFCLDNGISHRDIKLSNIVFPLDDNTGSSARLLDFGMACKINSDGKLEGRCGTPGYVAPEILYADVNEPYDANVDMFSIGVVAYVILSGYEPFEGDDPRSRIQSNKRCKWGFCPCEEWEVVPDSAKDLLTKMLEADPKKRITFDEALCHPFLKEYTVF